MKNIILSFDGTGNEASDAEQGREFFGLGELDDSSISNVLKLHLMFGGDLKDQNQFEDQVCLYYSGVGTYGKRFKRAFNRLFGLQNQDVDRIQENAREDLRRIYQTGDKIFIFGFSRGAAIARQFASRYVQAIAGDQVKPIKFLGVFDTVASIGTLNLDNDEIPVSDVVFEDRYISPEIENALHLLALDEKRKAFLPTLMNKEDRVTEVWFSGAHSDIGGGYRKDGLSDIPLQFMMDYIREKDFGLKVFNPNQIDYESLLPGEEKFKIDYTDVMMNPNPLSQSHQQSRPYFTSKLTLGDRPVMVMEDDEPGSDMALVYHTVAKRIYGDQDYKPQSLVHEKHMILRPNGEMVVHNGLQDHIRIGKPSPEELPAGEEKRVRVYANQRYNSSGVMLKPGQKYCFLVEPGQTWYDSSIVADARGWDVGDESIDLGWFREIAIKRKEDDRRVPDANWFELCGAVGEREDGLFRIMNHLCGEGNEFDADTKGEFCPFANDITDRYHNNLGFIDIWIRRTE